MYFVKESKDILYLIAEVLCKIAKFVTHISIFLCVTA